MKTLKLNIVIPCFNEEETLQYSAKELDKILIQLINENLIDKSSKICFINDGSTDNSLEIMENLVKISEHFSFISLSRNFGHQAALLAGLFETEADIYITIDADLQDDPLKIKDMIVEYKKGNEIVYGVRKSRDTDTFLKKITATSFYKLQKLLGIYTIYNSADFRLLSKKVVKELKKFQEKNLYIRGIIPLLGFNSSQIFYDRKKRELGKPKYSFSKSFLLSMNGLLGFSSVFLHLITFTGLFFSFVGFVLLVWAIYRYFKGQVETGWSSLFCCFCFFSGLIIFSLGIIGEYISKIFTEVKNRPIYLIEKEIVNDRKN